MKRTEISALLVVAALTASTAAFAPRGGDLDLSWNTIAGGGGVSSAGALALGATIGQPAAGGHLTGPGELELVVGFWAAAAEAPPCDEDVNGSGGVDFDDLLAILAAWGACPEPPDPCPEDLDGDGVVAFGDLLAVLSGWGPCV